MSCPSSPLPPPLPSAFYFPLVLVLVLFLFLLGSATWLALWLEAKNDTLISFLILSMNGHIGLIHSRGPILLYGNHSNRLPLPSLPLSPLWGNHQTLLDLDCRRREATAPNASSSRHYSKGLCRIKVPIDFRSGCGVSSPDKVLSVDIRTQQAILRSNHIGAVETWVNCN